MLLFRYLSFEEFQRSQSDPKLTPRVLKVRWVAREEQRKEKLK